VIDASLTVVRNDFPKISSRFEPEVADIINTRVLDTISIADGITPVDTGDLKNKKQMDMASPGNLSAQITWTMEYAGFVNFGTVYMAPRPYATSAADQTFPLLIADLSALEGRIT
jgi:hypothetical protein